jgi:indolepyruvate ferredoxin oxidoreductase beta subunit
VKKDILVVGVGGQGTVLAAKLVGLAARLQGESVRSAETIGMAQRGGPVASHVRIGGGAVSPLIPPGGADVLIAFEPWEALRAAGFLAPGALVVAAREAVPPPSAALAAKPQAGDPDAALAAVEKRCGTLVAVSREALLALGEEKCLNVALLGVAVGTGKTGLDADSVREAIARAVPARFKEMNLQVFEKGIEKGEQR